MNTLAIIFMALGILFSLAGNIGVLIFPDVYSRLQASSLAATTSVISVFIACMLLTGLSPMTGRILILLLFFLISSPVSTHIVARYAWSRGMVPRRKINKTVFPDARPDMHETGEHE